MNLFKQLGPGLLYAGAAIGVSHLVQSTRAGAEYGWVLVFAIIGAHIVKYPFFSFGPRYAAATGRSLLHGFQKLGNWTLWLFGAMTAATMFIVMAAISIVTAGITAYVFDWTFGAKWVAILILILAATLLFTGGYKALARNVKWIVILLAVASIAAFVAGITAQPIPSIDWVAFDLSNTADIAFLVAFLGWMPAPFDIIIWHSLWSVEEKQSGGVSMRKTMLDFRVGYWGTALMAIIFLGMGAITFYGKPLELVAGASGFANQLIDIYTSKLGSLSFIVISVAALATMFSTTITCLDAFVRVMTNISNQLKPNKVSEKHIYRTWMLIMVAGTAVILLFFLKNMRQMVDLATTIAFIVAPIIALLCYLAMRSSSVPKHYRMSNSTRLYSLISLLILFAFSFWFLLS